MLLTTWVVNNIRRKILLEEKLNGIEVRVLSLKSEFTVIEFIALASATISECLIQTDDNPVPCDSIIDKKLCYDHAL